MLKNKRICWWSECLCLFILLNEAICKHINTERKSKVARSVRVFGVLTHFRSHTYSMCSIALAQLLKYRQTCFSDVEFCRMFLLLLGFTMITQFKKLTQVIWIHINFDGEFCAPWNEYNLNWHFKFSYANCFFCFLSPIIQIVSCCYRLEWADGSV